MLNYGTPAAFYERSPFYEFLQPDSLLGLYRRKLILNFRLATVFGDERAFQAFRYCDTILIFIAMYKY